jgi:hypothetical protein
MAGAEPQTQVTLRVAMVHKWNETFKNDTVKETRTDTTQWKPASKLIQLQKWKQECSVSS